MTPEPVLPRRQAPPTPCLSARQGGWTTYPLRVLGAHALLVDGSSVEAAARALGYSSADPLRHHFRRTVGVLPTEARALATEEMALRLRRTG